MNRLQKSEAVDVLKEKFTKANAAFITEYRGMTVEKLYSLRSKVRQGQGELKVIKNRLARIAAKGSKFEGIADQFKGPLAVAFSYGDAVAVAKAVTEELSDTSPLQVKSASLDGKLIDLKGITALSKLPDRNTLISMLLSTLQAPTRNFACVLAAIPRDFVGVVTAVKDQKEKTK